ncbi:hypothetical protein [Streptomyces californicus]|uniref:hypothetical protein n=1 Tax=Streptomyces californicus TaxID=67351 RepID=UPI003406AFDE
MKLYQETGISADFEIHATRFVNGRDRPLTDPKWNRLKGNRQVVAQEELAVLAPMPGARMGAALRRADEKGPAYSQERAAVYEATLLVPIEGSRSKKSLTERAGTS